MLFSAGCIIFLNMFLINIKENHGRFMKMKSRKSVDIPKNELETSTEGEDGYRFQNEDQMIKFKLWPKGKIPYHIDEFSFDDASRDFIREYLSNLKYHSYIRFIELSPNEMNGRYVLFINRIGQLHCTDYTAEDFTTSDVQKVVLGYDCLNEHYMAAVILALAGIPPQHNAPDRDTYIEVIKNNILPDKVSRFNKIANDDWILKCAKCKKYDFNSASHYGVNKFSVNGDDTIKILQPQEQIGDRVAGLSLIDRYKLKYVYNNLVHEDSDHCDALFDPVAKPRLEDNKQESVETRWR